MIAAFKPSKPDRPRTHCLKQNIKDEKEDSLCVNDENSKRNICSYCIWKPYCHLGHKKWRTFHNWLYKTSKQYVRKNKNWGGGDSSVVRAPDSWLKGRGFESLLERRENFLLQGRLSVLTLISVSVPSTTVARKKSRLFCQKCRWQVTAKTRIHLTYVAFIEPCFGIGHNLSLICQMTSEDIKHQLIIIVRKNKTST